MIMVHAMAYKGAMGPEIDWFQSEQSLNQLNDDDFQKLVMEFVAKINQYRYYCDGLSPEQNKKWLETLNQYGNALDQETHHREKLQENQKQNSANHK